MSDLVERVAKAVVGVLEKSTDQDLREGIGHIYGLGFPEEIKAFEIAIGHAAIKAMREPTEEMVLAGCAKAREEQVRPISVNRKDAWDLWQAMIDNALKS